jgi:hypothetical protein
LNILSKNWVQRATWWAVLNQYSENCLLLLFQCNHNLWPTFLE